MLSIFIHQWKYSNQLPVTRCLFTINCSLWCSFTCKNRGSIDPVHDRGVHGPGPWKGVHGPSPYFDGPQSMDPVHGGVHGSGVHVLYFPVKESVVLTFWCGPGYIACWKMNEDVAYARNTESGCKATSRINYNGIPIFQTFGLLGAFLFPFAERLGELDLRFFTPPNFSSQFPFTWWLEKSTFHSNDKST